MKISYFQDTDTLYIELNEGPGDSTVEITQAQDTIVDVTSERHPVGIEIEHASQYLDSLHVETEGLPCRTTRVEKGRYRRGQRATRPYLVVRSSRDGMVKVLHGNHEIEENAEPENRETKKREAKSRRSQLLSMTR